MRLHWWFGLALLFPVGVQGQAPNRILRPIDDRSTVRLAGNVHPLARAEFDAGPMPDSAAMDRMILVFNLDPARQAELDQLVADQQDPASPQYQKWITPQEYGRRFGITDDDLNQISGWLALHGFQVEEIPDGRGLLLFSGTAGKVAEAFHTQMRNYRVNGKLHHANATDPEIPEALAAVVAGVASLHDFESVGGLTGVKQIPAPEYTSGSTHYMAPADFATIYDVNALYTNSVDGTGQTIAVVARSDFNLSDVQMFRSVMGLPVNNPMVVLNGPDPGVLAGNEQAEATLDAEWAGAVAKKATVKFVVSASTTSTDGVTLSAQYIVNHNLAPVMSTSFSTCEQAAGAAYAQLWSSLWQQAAAQGMTAFVASGDSGAAGCDSASAATAGGPLGVNVLGSSPFNVSVGGTQFSDASNPSQYWAASNGTGSNTLGSALTYIPEVVWNQSGLVPGGSELWASGGGASVFNNRPSWQAGPGVPADTHRHVPDVSIAASTYDGYMIYMNGGVYVSGGTSAATPSWAGVMALIVQRWAASQGNANPRLYALLGRQFADGAAVFHDITTGNNSVPGLAGYAAGVGYDQASGIGSPDAFELVQHWTDGALAWMNLSLSSSTAVVRAGSTLQVQAATSIGGGFKSTVALSVTGGPAGLTATWVRASVESPGSGSSTLILTAAANVAPGSYNLTVTAAGGGVTQSVTLGVKVTTSAEFQITLSAPAVSMHQNARSTVVVTATAASGFSGAAMLSLSGLPAGVTASFAPERVAGSGGTSTLTLTTTATARSGVFTPSVSATSGGATVTLPVRLTVLGTAH